MKIHILLFILALLLSSCSINRADLEDTDENTSISIDQDSYTAKLKNGTESYEFKLIADFKNKTSETIYLKRCNPESPNPVFNLQHTNKNVNSAFTPTWTCVDHAEHIEVKPGLQRVDTLKITGPNMWSENDEVIGQLEGKHKLLYEARSCNTTDHCPLPDSVAFSNVFEIKLED